MSARARARVTYIDPVDSHEVVEVLIGPYLLHQLQFGGQGDGYCYAHRSFTCIDDLTPEERLAVDAAEELAIGEYLS